MPLAQTLLELKTNAAQYVRPENQSVNDRTIAWLESSGIVDRALKVGHLAPEFSLTDLRCKTVSSAELLHRAPLVMVFFRGRWCPYCVAQLEALRDAFPQIEAVGASVIAISPQTPKQMDFMREQHRLCFPLLRDEGNQVAEKFGIAYEVPQEQQELYRRSFVNLPFINGFNREPWTLSIPSTFIVDATGTVRYASVHADFTERDDPETLIGKLAALK
jgi:peroxiredoxin